MTLNFISSFEDTGRIGTFLWHPNGLDALNAIRAALQGAGVEFIEENGSEPGVRLRDQVAPR